MTQVQTQDTKKLGRITPERLLAAIRRTKMRPIVGTIFTDDKEGCGIGITLIDIYPENYFNRCVSPNGKIVSGWAACPIYSKRLNSVHCASIMYVVARQIFGSNYIEGFYVGFDGYKKLRDLIKKSEGIEGEIMKWKNKAFNNTDWSDDDEAKRAQQGLQDGIACAKAVFFNELPAATVKEEECQLETTNAV